MKNYTYHFEIKDLLTQFVAAFDDCIIKRYDNNKVAKSNIEVRYVLAPKQRVLYDIINEQHNITLPVVAVNITGISRDNERVFNKIEGFYIPKNNQNNQKAFAKINSPVPINITVSMSIIGKYQSDIDQIISNFAPYSNPYIVIAWKIPDGADIGYPAEIRNKVLWSGDISITPPDNLTSSDKYRVVADTTFTIQGWLFKNFEDAAPIYFVNTTFYGVASSSLGYGSYFTMSGTDLQYMTDVISVSGIPTIKNIYYGLSGVGSQFEVTNTISLNNSLSNGVFTVLGEWFNSSKYFLLSSNNTSLFTPTTSITTAYQGTISGCLIENVSKITDGIITFGLPYTPNTGKFDLVIANDVGWASSSKNKNISFNLI